ncbi:hypothetical protein ACT3CD_16485 [Geofilum sp. OHC36d9]|uniref:hypothetical protein n=1 Tax=Geofilum sp. OHC36d9 TaxID=3458413 RepID=UPI00403386FE
MKKLALIILLLPIIQVFGQKDTLRKFTDYSFIIQDTPSQLFTMRQVNQSYLSGYRLFAKGLYTVSKNDIVADLLQIGIQSLFFLPFTHEEGHRSILTANNIGSISQPYFNKYGAAYVKGVTDQTLQDLRDTDLPTYIRLHSGGLESDYMLTKRMETIGSFEKDDFKYYKWEYWFRKLGILQYYVTGLLGFEIDLEEEDNELERDVVGYDTYGAARHLYRPDMDFYRYTKYKDLTSDEKKYVHRMGYRSLLNLLNPLMIGKGNFKAGENISYNIGMGYTMAPFGDFIDENIWIKYKDFNIHGYARQFQNRNNWFHGFGLSLIDLKLHNRIYSNISGHFWNQPDDYDFNTNESFSGGAVDMDLRYFFFNNRGSWLKGFSFDLGMIYKTEGFLPEELYFEENLGLRIGTTIRL